ncbi:MAG TPA: hypothetical protein PKO06_22705 [Candidatus Ozemobacteraceae bacterium]|nr:hypothetical protein [Candidatus Ozemobacteraceae bacterium]
MSKKPSSEPVETIDSFKLYDLALGIKNVADLLRMTMELFPRDESLTGDARLVAGNFEQIQTVVVASVRLAEQISTDLLTACGEG